MPNFDVLSEMLSVILLCVKMPRQNDECSFDYFQNAVRQYAECCSDDNHCSEMGVISLQVNLC